ncbi:MAG: MoxR family ATPase [Bradymonadales bacterium]|nr:MoxR family ATPase [Bradymonadales bacterium]
MQPANPSAVGEAVAQAAERFETFRARFARLTSEIQKVIVGYQEIIEGVLSCLLSDGHVLLEGVPGLGKTILVRTLGEVVQLDFGRIQFTPDLMPADIIGTNLIVQGPDGSRQFQFQRGPLFTHILLADEVNRATPKTQSALLQAMAEGQVTVSTQSYTLCPPYFVIATQNPLEMEGTYPLPEAQLDRFMFKLKVPFPNLEDLNTIMNRTIGGQNPSVSAVTGREELLEMQQVARRIPIAPHIQLYALRLLEKTHPICKQAPGAVKQYVKAGSSPRGGQAILKAARIRALVRGETAVGFEDVQAVALPALRHRILLNFEGEAEGVDTDDIVAQILAETKKA